MAPYCHLHLLGGVFVFCFYWTALLYLFSLFFFFFVQLLIVCSLSSPPLLTLFLSLDLGSHRSSSFSLPVS